MEKVTNSKIIDERKLGYNLQQNTVKIYEIIELIWVAFGNMGYIIKNTYRR